MRIALNEEGRAKGFAHVQFGDPSSAKKGMGLNGQELDGRQQEALAPPQHLCF